ncbi:signal transduction histidine kinase [Anaerotaenia torta]|uniref:sensor histidine kinase n=1 Tax=Anaerotaenia torta TaxID=433293 RepID=UPI003D218AC8
MSLSRKTFLYSAVISVIMISLIVGYFILMLPPLYVSYMQNRNYASVLALQEGYMELRSYDRLEVKNPSATITIEIPKTGNRIFIVNKLFRITVEVQEGRIQELLEKIRYYAAHTKELSSVGEEDFNLDQIMEELELQTLPAMSELLEQYPLKFDIELFQDKDTFRVLSSKLHMESESLMIFEGNVTDGQNYYTSYIALGMTEETIDITVMPIMTPRIEEISPIIFQSLPMIVAVTLLLVLVSSRIFSRHIIQPIIRLARHAQYRASEKDLRLEPIPITGKDEISSLGKSLNGLYQRIQESYGELEIKNQHLTEENKRQEVFLRASSHQLKTPISAALLLVQGMISEVGRYKEVKEYLPRVKEQLLSMERIVEDIIYLNHCSQNLELERISLPDLLEECLGNYRVQIEEKALDVIWEKHPLSIDTDRELMKKILDNLISNAVYFTPGEGRLHISCEEERIRISNYGVTIDEELLPHVFDPFVTSVDQNKGHGLGLYVVSYYAGFLGCQVKLRNIDGGVEAELVFRGNPATSV